jgi:hypothetical protein
LLLLRFASQDAKANVKHMLLFSCGDF